MEIYEVDKIPVRTSKMKWRDMIHTRRGQRVQIRVVIVIYKLR